MFAGRLFVVPLYDHKRGRVPVIMDTTDYSEKIRDVLKDKETYEKIDRDPTKSYKDKLIKLLQSLRDKKEISSDLYKKVYPSSATIPKFYGLPKVHKENIPLRPIVSSIGSLTYNLAKYLADILKPLVGENGYSIKNTEDFVQKVKNHKVDETECTVSYDVKSLFTSVPVVEAVTIAVQKLEADDTLPQRTGLRPSSIGELLKFCLQTTYFIRDNQFYIQKEGAAMGSPLSPIIANLFMENLEEKAIENAPIPPKFWGRFVDDTFVIIKRDDEQSFSEHLNKQHERIKFTKEVCSADKRLPFLDTMSQIEQDGSLSFSVYRKPTHTNQYLHFQSNHSLDTKRGVVKSLFRRAETLVTKEEDLKKEKELVCRSLKECGYPEWLIKEGERHATNNVNRTRNDDDIRCTAVLPYIPSISNQLRRIFKRHRVRVCFSSQNTIKKQLVHLKDKTNDQKKSGVIYKIDCKDCIATYVGETKRELVTRIREHRRPTLLSTGGLASAVIEHSMEYDHNINWNNVKIIDNESHDLKRRVKEAIHIKTMQPKMNRDNGYQLDNLYHKIL